MTLAHDDIIRELLPGIKLIALHHVGTVPYESFSIPLVAQLL